MTTEEQAMVGRALAEAAALFDADLSPAKVAVWLRAVDDLPADRVVAALRAAERSSRYLPRPSEVRDALGASTGDAAASAWVEACNIVRLYRPEDRDSVATPEIREAVRLIGGWARIGATKEEHLPFVEKEFRERWSGAVARVESGLALPSAKPAAVERSRGLERIG